MLLSGIIPLATYLIPMVAGLALLPFSVELGTKAAVTAYTTVAILSLFIVPDREAAMMFIFFFGYYPILKSTIEKMKSSVLKFMAKYLIFNISIFSAYWIIIYLFSMRYILEEFGGNMLLTITVLMANIAFYVYDKALVIFKILYINRIRKKLGFK